MVVNLEMAQYFVFLALLLCDVPSPFVRDSKYVRM